MSIYINNILLNTQPTELLESYKPLQTDQEALDGTMRRNKYGQKRSVAMKFPILAPSDYQTIFSYFTTGSGIYYSNDASKFAGGVFSFSGLPMFDDDYYVPGASLYSAFTVNIREI